MDFSKPCYPELVLMILTSSLHIVIEFTWDGAKAGMPQIGWAGRIYNLVAILVWGGYVLWRVMNTRGIADAWGFRRDNFAAACYPCSFFSITATAILFMYGSLLGRSGIPPTFWIVLLLYLLYGLAQQFALQILITKNLRDIVRSQPLRILLATSLFSAAHFPDHRLMGLTFPAGLVFTWIFERHPNLWAVGISHGLLGAFAYYWVLGLDPGAEMIEAVQRFPL
jgi:hypothetical protein